MTVVAAGGGMAGVDSRVTGKLAASSRWRAGLTGGQHRQAENLRNAFPCSPPRDQTKMTVAASKRAAGDAVSGRRAASDKRRAADE